jgi:hypothetical protein
MIYYGKSCLTGKSPDRAVSFMVALTTKPWAKGVHLAAPGSAPARFHKKYARPHGRIVIIWFELLCCAKVCCIVGYLT